MIVRRFAPIALRTPISRVRSATDTNMMFIMPMPPTNNDSPVMSNPTMAITPATLLNDFTNCSWRLMAKSSGSPGATCRSLRMMPRNSSSALSISFTSLMRTLIVKSGLRQ